MAQRFLKVPIELNLSFFLANTVENENGCWLWKLRTDTFGYGKYGGDPVHRLSYQALIGPIPIGLLVCHTCDVPACVNPDHFFLGTARDNMLDRERKGRGNKGMTWKQKKNRHPRSHCKWGHALTTDNRYRGVGQCLVCRRANGRNRKVLQTQWRASS
jgi:hypothetical protein